MDSIAKCAVCTESGTCENRVATCNRCCVSTHTECYGIRNEDCLNWMCAPCQQGISAPIVCEICQQSRGAFKPTSCGKWAHVVCALFTDGVEIGDATRIEPINLSKIANSKCRQTCVFCSKAVSFWCQCSMSECKNAIHMACAHTNGCLQIITNDKIDAIQLCAFCADHKPNNCVQRLSFACVQKILAKKTSQDPVKLHGSRSAIKMDRMARGSLDNSAFETDLIDPSDPKRRNDDIAGTSVATIANNSFSPSDEGTK